MKFLSTAFCADLLRKGAVLAVSGFAAISCSSTQSESCSLQDLFSNYSESKPILMAHRMSPFEGYSENSLSLLQYNIENFPSSIQEIDVRITADSVAVLLHDATLERTTTGEGELNAYTFAELQEFNLLDPAGNILEDRIPLLEDILELSKGRILVMLDMKPGTDPDIMMAVVEQTQTLDEVIVICYNLDQAEYLYSKYPTIMLALGYNGAQSIEKMQQAGLPLRSIIALTPGVVQDDSFYAPLNEVGMAKSYSAQGRVDADPNASQLYRDAFDKGVATIICTDSLAVAHRVFEEI